MQPTSMNLTDLKLPCGGAHPLAKVSRFGFRQSAPLTLSKAHHLGASQLHLSTENMLKLLLFPRNKLTPTYYGA